MATFSGIAHIAVVARDMITSVDWYRTVLGFEPVGAVMPGPDGAGLPRQPMRHADSGLMVVVFEPVRRSGDLFDPFRTGLNHFSLVVDGRAGIDKWARRLDELGISRSPVRDVGYAQFITTADPDGIAWELWAPVPAEAQPREG
jgi:glyoxylase I family protein